MDKTYSVVVNGEHKFDFTEAEIEALDSQKLLKSLSHILQDGKSFTAEMTTSDFINKNYTVKINSTAYGVHISNALDQRIKEMGLTAKVSKAVNDIKAPMPGLILEVNVVEGQEVKQGDYLLVLEAMKMENTLTAPRDGVVKKLPIKQGQTVDKNQLLVEME